MLRVCDKQRTLKLQSYSKKKKDEVAPAHAANAKGGVAVKLHSFLTSALHGGD